MIVANTQLLFEKIQSLSPERMAEVDDFVDFLKLKEQESLLTQSAAELSTPSFVAIWDSAEDEAYDDL